MSLGHNFLVTVATSRRDARVEAVRLRRFFKRVFAGKSETEELQPLLDSVNDRKMYGAPATDILNARANLVVMLKKPGIAFKCGPFALGRIQKFLHPDQPLSKLIIDAKSTPKGFSLLQVKELADQLGMNFQAVKRPGTEPLILPAVVHWKSGHYAAILKKEKNRYVVQDPTFGHEALLKEDAIDSESSGYFLIPKGNLAKGWAAVNETEAGNIWGRGFPSTRDGKQTKECDCNTDCDGNSISGPDSGDPNYASASNIGMARPSILLLLACLRIKDRPISYRPAVGPPVDFKVTYNQYEASQIGTFVTSNLGNNWIQPWQSYVKSSGSTGGTISVLPMGGGYEVYSGYQGTASTGSYGQQVQLQTKLYVMPTTNPARAAASNKLRYERQYPDGSKEVFDSPADSRNFIYLTQIIDPQGNAISLNYQAVSAGYRLTSVIDSLGQATTLTYGLADDPLKITAITDPFGRTAKFGYTVASPHQLTSITDVVGIVSRFVYAPGTDAITALTTPYGTTTFAAAQDNLGDTTLVITDPNGGQEKAWARYADYINSPIEPLPNVPSNPFIYSGGVGDDDNSMEELNTYYWDKKAMMDAPGDLTKAHVYHWLFDNEAAAASGVLYCEKAPLESRVWYNYNRPAGMQPYFLGTSDRPIGIARLLDDGSTQYSQASYNALGMPTQSIDPLGRQMNYTYAANNIDLTLVKGANGDVLRQITYDQAYPPHLPKTVTNASGQSTTFTYNSFGQILTLTNAKGEMTTFAYDGNHNLTSIAGALAGATASFTYDGYGRVRTVTDSEGYTVTQDYDALNRPTVTTYPDGTFEQSIYNVLDVGWKKDRLNRWTTLTHDAVRNLVAVQDPLGRTTSYGYCACGALISLVDPAGNVTGWTRDVQKRPTAKVYADGTKTLYAYDLAGRLSSETDAKGQVRNYGYNLDNTLKQKSYAHAQVPTASVSFIYDPNYSRVAAMTDGTGSHSYTYNPYSANVPPAVTTGAGRLATETSPLANAVIAYGYDELGRINSQSINGAANSTSITYDSLGRTTSVTNPLGAFIYNYLNATNRLRSVAYPNGQSTAFTYFPNAGDQRLQEIKNLTPSGAILSKFDYTYNAEGNIQSWTQQTDASTPTVYNYQYDAADQLTAAVQTDTATHAVLRQYVYSYDAGGNRTSEQIGSQVNAATVNSLNQLTATQGGGPLRFSGTLSEPATVTVGGNPATVSGTSFTGSANVTPGTNQIVVAATNNSGETTRHTYQVTATGSAPKAFNYDAEGNTTSDGARTYEWDAENRMTAINYVGTPSRSEITYDGLARRVAIIEKTNGTVTSKKEFIFVGLDLAEERDANNIVRKRFFPEGEQIDGTAYFFTRDHLGSVREMTDAAGAIHARYDYGPFGVATKLSGDLDADFGFTGHYVHPPSGIYFTLYRAFSANSVRWLSRDPIAESGGLNLYGYVGNNPINTIDLLGLDYWFLNDSGAVMGQGHCASVVGNPELGYHYYSKDGTKAGNTYKYFQTFDGFLNDPVSSRYDRGVQVETNWDQDVKMKSHADDIYNTPYSGMKNNCSNLSREIMGSGDIDPKYKPFLISRPNGVYDSMTGSKVGNPVPIHPKPGPPPRPLTPLGY